MIASFYDLIDNMTALVEPHGSGYLVRLLDDDSGLAIVARLISKRSDAIAYARSLVTARDAGGAA